MSAAAWTVCPLFGFFTGGMDMRIVTARRRFMDVLLQDAEIMRLRSELSAVKKDAEIRALEAELRALQRTSSSRPESSASFSVPGTPMSGIYSAWVVYAPILCNFFGFSLCMISEMVQTPGTICAFRSCHCECVLVYDSYRHH